VTQIDEHIAVESQGQNLWVRGRDGTTQHIDARGAALLGRAPEDICGHSWFDLVHPDDVDRARLQWNRAVRDDAPYEITLRMSNGYGDYCRMVERGSPLYGQRGPADAWAGTLTVRLTGAEAHSDVTQAILETLQSSAPVGFVFVDREFRYVRVNEKVAAIHGSKSVKEHLGHTVAEVVPTLWAQLESSYHSVLTTGIPVLNVELSGPTAEDPGRNHHWLESIYPVHVDAEIIGLGVVLIDITERKEAERALVALTEAAVDAIAAAAEARDPYTAGHQRRVADLAVAIATEMGLDRFDVEGIRIAAKIHDVGKLRMPSEILNKPGALSSTELALLKEHALAGADIVRGIDFPWPIAEMIVQHHERLDGSGYPNALSGDEILVGARIIAVADVVDAMSSRRPYRASRGMAAALRLIEQERGTRLDAEVVDTCVRLFRRHQFNFGMRRPRYESRVRPRSFDDHVI
jgi:putative nucleotidyltransferase with HDIG domain/PAS domain S-box-containing protein